AICVCVRVCACVPVCVLECARALTHTLRVKQCPPHITNKGALTHTLRVKQCPPHITKKRTRARAHTHTHTHLSTMYKLPLIKRPKNNAQVRHTHTHACSSCFDPAFESHMISDVLLAVR